MNPWLTWTPIFFIIFPHTDGYVEKSVQISQIQRHLASDANASFPLDSDAFIIIRDSMNASDSDDSYNIYEIYTQKNILRVEPILFQTEAFYHTFSNYLTKSVRRQNFNGTKIYTVGYVSFLDFFRPT